MFRQFSCCHIHRKYKTNCAIGGGSLPCLIFRTELYECFLYKRNLTLRRLPIHLNTSRTCFIYMGYTENLQIFLFDRMSDALPVNNLITETLRISVHLKITVHVINLIKQNL